jgi:chromosome partitioning protein
MITLAVAGRKGGVAKTTTAVSLAACLAERGRRVLLIDLDPQGHAGTWAGCDRRPGLAAVFLSGAALAPLAVPGSIPGVDVIPADPAAGGADRWDPLAVVALAGAVAALPADRWGVVILDTPPNYGTLTAAALVAAGLVVAPVEPAPLALAGLAELRDTVDRARTRNPGLRLLVLPVRVRLRRRVTTAALAKMEAFFPGDVLPTVRDSVTLTEAPGHRRAIIHHDPAGAGAADYRAVVTDLERRTGI